MQFMLNGKTVEVDAQASDMLLWVIRTDLKFTGTKYGCGIGFCGSCTVLMDGKPVRACQTAMEDVVGKNITTIEGLGTNGELHPVQKAFVEHDAMQCGYCTPGMVMKAVGLLNANPNPSREQIIEAMNENLCRCGSYMRIVNAIESAAKEMANMR